MVKFIKIFNIILAALLLVSFGFILGKRYDILLDSENNISFVRESANEQKLKKLFNLLDAQYIKDVDSDSMMDATLNYILQGLDPHSVYFTANQNGRNSDVSGEFNGLGIEFYVLSDTITIIRNIPGSPNSKFFIPGDKLLKINDIKVTGNKVNTLTHILDNNTEYELLVKRNKSLKKFKVKKRKVPISSVHSYYELGKGVGYIRLAHFSKNAYSQFNTALKSLQRNGMQTLVIDLRDNGGGLLEEAEKIADEFLANGKTIFYLQNEKDQSKEYHKAHSGGKFEKGKVIILINENTASASEVLAGALQDNDRATIVGRRSYGKGLVQREIKLEDGSTFRITTAKYYTPSGRSIQKNYSNSADYENEIHDRYISGELYDESKIKKIDSLKKKTPGGKTVYGGGGIIPDVFVSIPQLDFGKNFYYKDGGSLLRNEVIQDIGENIPEYYRLDANDFIDEYQPNRLYKRIFKAMNEQGIQLNSESEKVLKLYIKAFVGKIIFGEDVFLKIWNEQDNMVQKAIELSKN